MESVAGDREFQALLASDAYNFLMQCGINVVKAAIEDIPRMKDAVINNYCIFSCKTELDEIVCGLDSLEVGNLLRKKPRAFLPLFLNETKPLTPGMLQDIITLDFSIMGSNARETEEEGTMNWVTFLSEFEADGKIDVFEDDVNTLSSFMITLADMPSL